MEITFLEVLDTTIKVGLGALIGGMGAYVLEASRYRHEVQKEALRLQHETLIKPIVEFVDGLLVPIAQVYWSHLDQDATHIRDRLVALRDREGIAEARVNALNNPTLRDSFSRFTQQLVLINNHLEDRSLSEARDQMHTAFRLAGEVLADLYKVPGTVPHG